MGLSNLIKPLFGEVDNILDFVDSLHTSTDEKEAAKRKIIKLKEDMKYRSEKLQADIVLAEAKSEHKLTSIWRPLTMLALVATIVVYAFVSTLGPIWGYTPPQLPEAYFQIILYGLTGYIGLRGGEKIAKEISKGFGQNNKPKGDE